MSLAGHAHLSRLWKCGTFTFRLIQRSVNSNQVRATEWRHACIG